jgi:hypothetical protein
MRKALPEGLILLLFVLLSLAGVLFHEIWRDEAQVWLLAKHSGSLTDLIHNTRYEGHPVLWHLLVMPLTRLSGNLVYMNLLHAGVAAAGIGLLVFYSPFTRLQKLLIPLGYFLLFEYNVLARNYAVEVLLLFALCVLFSREKKRPWLIASALWLLCQTNVFGVLLSLPFAALFAYHFQDRRQYKALALLLGIYATGLAASLIQIIPAPDMGYAVKWRFTELSGMYKSFTTVFKSYIPIPEFVYSFWNTHLIMNKVIKLLFTVGFLLILTLRFKNRPALLLFFWSGNIALWLFFYAKHYGSIRHHGHVFLVLLVSLWLEPYVKKSPRELFSGWSIKPLYFTVFLYAVLLVQAFTGIYSLYRDWRDPFSQSGYAAEYIRRHHLDKYPLVADRDYLTMPLSALLDIPLHYPMRDTSETYIRWDKIRNEPAKEEQVIRKVQALLSGKRESVLLVLSYPLRRPELIPARELARFGPAITEDEIYFIYLAEYKSL